MTKLMEGKLKVNPFTIFGVRRAQFPPNHFDYANIPLRYNMEEAVERWIKNNLRGRYYVGKAVIATQESGLEYTVRVGFEDMKELSYFMLACPLLKYK